MPNTIKWKYSNPGGPEIEMTTFVLDLSLFLWRFRIFINIQCCLQGSFVLEVSFSDVAMVETRFLSPDQGLFALQIQL